MKVGTKLIISILSLIAISFLPGMVDIPRWVILLLSSVSGFCMGWFLMEYIFQNVKD